MLHKYIKYEKISKEIKEEISRYHNDRLSEDPAASEEESIRHWFDERFDEWMFAKCKGSNVSDKRRYFRVDVQIPIKIVETLIESSEEDSSGIDLIGNVVNISRGGLYFKYNKPFELSSIVKIFVDFSSIDPELEEIEALAMVVRIDDFDDGEYGIGVLFSSIYDENRFNLDIFILKHVSNYLSADRL